MPSSSVTRTLPTSRVHVGISDRALERWFLAGLLLIPLQFLTLGPAQPAHLWAMLLFGLMIFRLDVRVRPVEIYFFAFFIAMAIVATRFGGYERIKSTEQILKFVAVYPAFYLIGRLVGERYRERALPYGYAFVWCFIGFEYAVQFFEVPYLYQLVTFAQGAIHGTFKERNWFAIFVFLLTYLLLLKSKIGTKDLLKFLGTSVVVALLSESKTILVASGIVVLFQVRGRIAEKAVMLGSGAALYVYRFGNELSGQMLKVRLEDERGLAFKAGTDLIKDNVFGYGFGFVEAYFSRFWFVVKGLGMGTNSIFCTPLDLMIIAGVPGLLLWIVFFAGVGLGAVGLLAPVAAWSLLNPLHQSELVYLFAGILVSWGLHRQTAETSAPTRRGVFGFRSRYAA
jgi:hypothetical protein